MTLSMSALMTSSGSRRDDERRADLNFELYFVTEVLKLRSLHYGYWDSEREDEPINLDEIRCAQARFTERLMAFIPPDTKSVLDVGAGIGDNAFALSQRGHSVTAISPDRNHERYFDEMVDSNVTFERSTFESFQTTEVFDLVLFSESHRYFDRRLGLEKAKGLIRSGGHLLVSGMFRPAGKVPFSDDYDVTELDYIQMAAGYGFAPVSVSDITPHVFPTVQLIHRALNEIVDPTLRFAEAYALARSPWKAKLFRLLLSKEDRTLERAFRKLRRKANPERFRAQYRYATILFRAD